LVVAHVNEWAGNRKRGRREIEHGCGTKNNLLINQDSYNKCYE